MRHENYKEEVDFTEEQIKIDRRRDPAIEYTYEDKGSIFKKMSKERAEKQMHKKGHIGIRKDSDLGENYSSPVEDYHEDVRYSDDNKNEESSFNKAMSWVEKNTSGESKDLFNNLRKEYKTIQGSIENNRNKGKNKAKKSNGYKTCSKCGAQMHNDAKVCTRCGESQDTGGFFKLVTKKVGTLVLVIIVINLIIGFASFFITDNSQTPESSTSGPYIELSEYKKEVPLKYLVDEKDIIKTDKEEVSVGKGKDIPAGEYLFVKNNPETAFASIEVFSILDKEVAEIHETINRNCYVKLDNGDTVKLDNGILYKADQVELDMTNDENRKSGMYRIGKDVGDTFIIEGDSETYFSVLGAENNIIVNGFLDEGDLLIDPEFIEENSFDGEVPKYIQVNDGIINTQ